ncbi:MAG TPA: CsbD family protein [Methylomirabilota bacterium]|jgi:uncharacterized protein YjbJ (UPF0337 family)|nr:CsbD family protein [Methylomirabilota bacterium]
MNQDAFEGKWRELRGKARSWWGRLTDDDVQQVAGKKDELVGRLQAKYGYSKDEAEQEIDRHMNAA